MLVPVVGAAAGGAWVSLDEPVSAVVVLRQAQIAEIRVVKRPVAHELGTVGIGVVVVNPFLGVARAAVRVPDEVAVAVVYLQAKYIAAAALDRTPLILNVLVIPGGLRFDGPERADVQGVRIVNADVAVGRAVDAQGSRGACIS